MIMTTTFSHRLSAVILGCATALILIGSGSPLRAQSVAVMVNGEPITNYDIEQRGKLITLSTHKPADRQQVINELIDEKVKLKEGKKFGIEPTSADVEQSYATMSARMRISADQLTKSLESQGIRPDTLKARMKVEMVWTNLVRGRYKESLQVSEKDVEDKTKSEDKGEEKPETKGFEYKMQPIVLIVPRGSDAATVETRRKEAEAPSHPDPDLRRGERPLQVDAKRRDPRFRDQDLGRHPATASRSAGRHTDRSFDPARGDQTGRGDGLRCAAEIQPWSIRRKRKKSATRCSPINSKQSRRRIWRSAAELR